MKLAAVAILLSALAITACSSAPSADEIATETAAARAATAVVQSSVDSTSTAMAAPTQHAIQTRQADSQATVRARPAATATAIAQQAATRTAAAGAQLTATASAPTNTPTPEPTATPTPGPSTSFGNGTHIVGRDILPGTYRSPGADGCYWARLRGFGGTTAEIIANNFGGGQQVVTILASDAGFESTRCGRWEMLQ